MDFRNSNKLLFISAFPAGHGYRFGRIVSCFDNVHWYENQKNGKYPWSVSNNNAVKGKSISAYHYDRRTSKNMIPLLGERVEKYWNPQDLDIFYNEVWTRTMSLAGAEDILREKYLTWILHDSPSYLRKVFPNSKILNLIENDLDLVAERYLKTTALFPIKIENKNIKPPYLNEFSESLERLFHYNPDPTYRDFWIWKKFNMPFYDISFDREYKNYISLKIRTQAEEKNKPSENVLDVSVKTIDLESIKTYLGSQTIDANVSSLLIN
jgi:hypothetical protein